MHDFRTGLMRGAAMMNIRCVQIIVMACRLALCVMFNVRAETDLMVDEVMRRFMD